MSERDNGRSENLGGRGQSEIQGLCLVLLLIWPKSIIVATSDIKAPIESII